MIARYNLALLVLCALPFSSAAVVFSGEVRSGEAQPIFVPPSNVSPVVLRYYVADGSVVKKGDVVLRIDAGQAAAQIRTFEAQIEQAQAKSAKEIADLQLKAVKAEAALVDAQAALDTAKIDAGLPSTLISALDFDRYRTELDRAQRDLTFKQEQLAEARAAIVRRRDDAKLELDKLTLQRDFNQVQVDAAEVRAGRAGTVVHGFSTLFGAGGRIDEGSSAFMGQQVGEVAAQGSPRVRTWVLEPDRAELAAGTKTTLRFDALPGRSTHGTIATISGAPQAKPEWGDGSYFVVDIDLADADDLPLKPGMNVRIDTAPTMQPASKSATIEMANDVVRANGEVYAQTTSTLSPPEVENMWQLTITQMAPDGGSVKKGDPLVSFDVGELMKNLNAKQSELAEKSREQEKLHLELAEKMRVESLASAEAAADATKAQRMANRPETYVPGVEFKKLLIAKRKADLHRELAKKNELAAATERAAEQRLIDNDVVRLNVDVERTQNAIAQLNLLAPRDGIFLHGNGWDGKKIDNGTQIWRGQSVGEIPDMTTLAVRATLLERDLLRVKTGDTVRVIIEGGSGQSLAGHVAEVGFAVHSKSRVEPLPVVDLRILLEPTQLALKPGQPVRVETIPNVTPMAVMK